MSFIKYKTEAKIEVPGDNYSDTGVITWIKGGETAVIRKGNNHVELSQAQLRWLAQWAYKVSTDLGPDIAPTEKEAST